MPLLTLQAEKKSSPINPEGAVYDFQSRTNYVYDKEAPNKLILFEAILVGNYQNQIKFSELTLDVYRILQLLEREPLKAEGEPVKRFNPHKYLLFRPNFQTLFQYLGNAFKVRLFVGVEGSLMRVGRS